MNLCARSFRHCRPAAAVHAASASTPCAAAGPDEATSGDLRQRGRVEPLAVRAAGSATGPVLRPTGRSQGQGQVPAASETEGY